MSRIKTSLDNLKQSGKKALIPYITAGDPQLSVTVPTMHALVEKGADILEIGVPFSDPMADGPVIQLACERALANGTSLRDILGLVEEFRSKDKNTPVVLMGYLNPVEVMGYEQFAEAAKNAGVDGVLLVDMPPEEAESVAHIFKARNLDLIFLLAPTTTNERAAKICAHASGYIYYVSLKGVTGSAALDVESVKAKLADLREITDLPIGVGFGIKDAETATKVASVADGVVVGSVLVNQIESLQHTPDQIPNAVSSIIGEMRTAMDK